MHMEPFGKREYYYAQWTEIKHKEEILSLLESIQVPVVVADMHCKPHQSG